MFFYFNFGKRKQIEEALMPWMIMFGQSSEVTVAHMVPKSQCVVSWLSPKGFVSSGISNDSYKKFYLWGKWDKFDKLKAFQSKKNTLQFSYCTFIVLILIPLRRYTTSFFFENANFCLSLAVEEGLWMKWLLEHLPGWFLTDPGPRSLRRSLLEEVLG